MVEHERYEALMLEHLYGLLEPDEARDLQAYLETPAGAVLRAQATAWQAKIGSAAKVEHPEVSFQVPANTPATSPMSPTSVVVPASELTEQLTVSRVWARWGVAAALLLVLGGLGGPAGYQFIGWFAQSQEVEEQKLALARRKDELAAAEKQQQIQRDAAQKELDTAAANAEDVAKNYTEALQGARKAIEEKQFLVRLNGPPRIQPGAPNRWEISTLNARGAFALPKKMDVVVKDDQDRELLRQTHNQPVGPTFLNLTTAFWGAVKPGSDLFLEVIAYTDDDRRSVLAERVPLARPVFVTHLVTDKPLYKPGETIRFRSLTLDRGTFLPPANDIHLRFRLRDPLEMHIPLGDGNGRVVAGMRPVLGPDGKSLRGIGVGEYDLPPDAAGGEYKLDVLEVEPSGKENVLETRKFLVNRYTVDVFEKKLEFDGKTYGPGDAVQARLEVSRTAGGPMKDARAAVTATVDGRTLLSEKDRTVTVVPIPGTANTKAILDVRFRLPSDLFERAPRKDVPPNATLTVTIRDGDTVEAIVRPVPLVTRNLKIEFFPEGGDLIAGVEGRVYFQVRTPQNKPADLKGRITDGTDTVAEIATLTDAENPGANRGQGAFAFTPKAGKKYFLKLVSPPGIVEPTKDGFPLPVVKDDGIALTALDTVTEKGAPIRVRLRSANGPKVLHVGAYARGRLIGQQRVEIEAGKPVDVSIGGDDGLGGVTRVTVFEEPKAGTLIPRAERLIYRKPGEGLILTVNPDKARYSPSDKVKLELGALNEKEAPVPAVLMVGVINRSVVAMADNKTDRLMPTHFLLAGDVKYPADLEHADFLLTDHPTAAVALDLLLGTQGWRRFAEQSLAPANPMDRGEVERMLVAHGQRPAASVELAKMEEQRISAEFRPKLEEARLRYAEARDAWVGFQSTKVPELQQQVTAARSNKEFAEKQYTDSAAELYHFETRAARIRSWALPAFLLGLLALGVGGVILAARRQESRRRLMYGSAGAFALCALIFGAVILTRATDETRLAKLSYDRDQAKSHRGGTTLVYETGPAPGGMAPMPATKAPPMAKDAAPPRPEVMPPPAAVVRGPKKDDPKKMEPAPQIVGLPRPGMVGPDAKQMKPRQDRDRVKDLLANIARGAGGPIPVPVPAPEFGGPKAMVAAPEGALPVEAPPTLVREYAHQRDPALGETRVDFTETVYWHPVLVLPTSGKTTVEFQLSDDIARYEILVAGHTTDGRIGAVKHTIEARKPFTVDPKLPLEVSSTDVIDVPVRVMNDSDAKRSVDFTLNPVGFTVEGAKADGRLQGSIDLDAGKGGRKVVRIKPGVTEGDAALEVVGTSPAASPDAAARLVKVVPEGFPGVGQVSDMLEGRAQGVVTLPKDVIPGTLKVRLEMYPTTMADLVKGLDGLLREPCGCFEQSSTANYPNTLILQYLNTTNQAKPEAARRAKDLLDRGYSKLTSFEVLDTPTKAKQGFEWFGTPDQAHEALTAYGLLQFKDMARVHAVDPELIKRTQAFLLSRRDGKGGFKTNPRAVDSFGRAPKHTTDAYIVWALVESDPDDAEKLDLAKEIAALKAEAMNADSTGGEDPYYTALAANVLLQRGDRETALRLLDRLKEKHVQGGAVTGAVTSITRSGGRDLDIETTALTLLGWLRANETRYAGPVKDATKWLSQQRGGRGGFGSTQSTILALKALVLHARLNARPAEGGELKLLVAGKPVATRTFTDKDVEVIAVDLDKPEERLALGAKTEIEVVTTAKQPYPFTLSYSYSTLTPVSAEKCAVRLETKLGRTEGTEGETIPLTVRLENKEPKGQGMAVAVVGLPAGMRVPTDLKQLTNLRESGQVSHFETRGRELVLYWRDLAPGQKVELSVELVCDVPGTYRGPASRAYLYYNADHKHWVEPLAVAIKPAE
jgi:hypothetical protein